MTGRPYTTQQLADRWSCSPQAIRKMIRGGKLVAFTVGIGARDHYRIAAEEVERVEQCRDQPRTSPQALDPGGTEGAGAPSGETTPTIPAALLRRQRSIRKPSAPPGSPSSALKLVGPSRDEP